MKQILGNIASIETLGLVDGPGVRFVVFLQGCPLRCAYCHNPEMWNYKEIKQQVSAQDLVAKIKRYVPYFKNGGGVTFSGGEPLMQIEFVTEVFRLLKKEKIHTCLDTSGCLEATEELLDLTDLVILDVKSVDVDAYEDLVGKPIDNFLKFLKICQSKNKKMWLRQVIVPNYNDTEESVLKLKTFASKLKNIEKIELLPYHSMAKQKYKTLGIPYRLENVEDMNKERCEELQKLVEK